MTTTKTTDPMVTMYILVDASDIRHTTYTYFFEKEIKKEDLKEKIHHIMGASKVGHVSAYRYLRSQAFFGDFLEKYYDEQGEYARDRLLRDFVEEEKSEGSVSYECDGNNYLDKDDEEYFPIELIDLP